MAQKVKNDQGEVFGRNQALKFLKKALAGHGLRIDLQKVFHNLELHELLAIYFDRTNADDVSQVQYFTPKRHFRRLVRRIQRHEFTTEGLGKCFALDPGE